MITPEIAALNLKISTTPVAIATPTIITTAPLISAPSYAGGVTVMSAADNQAMISQQAYTNTVATAKSVVGDVTSSASSAVNLGNDYISSILPGPAGMTTGQLASSAIGKPGSGPAMNYLISNGADPEKLMTSLSSGTVTEQGTQVGVVAESMVKTTNNLINTGVISGGENPPEVAGIIAAGAIGSASSALGGIGGSAAAALSGVGSVLGTGGSGDVIASGAKVATGLAEGLTGGIPGLSSSVSGLTASAGGLVSSIPGAPAIGGGLAGLTAGAQGAFKSAFTAVEGSYKNLKGGSPNKLGGDGATESATTLTSPSSQYNIAAAEVVSAEDKLFAAKKAFRNENTPETSEALRKAEQALAQAKQQQSSASSAFISGAASSITGIFTSSKPVTTANSGLNILPGGMSAIVGQVGGAVSTVATSLKGLAGGALSSVGSIIGNITGAASGSSIGSSIGSVVGQITSSLSNPGALVGNLLGNTGKAITGLLGGAGGAVTGLLSSLKTGLSSLGPASNGVKTAVTAVGTFDKTAIAAKSGQLLGDAKIPNPSQAFLTVQSKTTTPDQSVEKVNQSLIKLNLSEDELKKQRLKVEAALTAYLTSETADSQKNYEAEYTKYQELEKSAAAAQVEYELSLIA